MISEYAQMSDGCRVTWRSERTWMRSDNRADIEPTYILARACIYVIDERTIFGYFHAALTALEELGHPILPASLYLAPFEVDMSSCLAQDIASAAQQSVRGYTNRHGDTASQRTPMVTELGVIVDYKEIEHDLEFRDYVQLEDRDRPIVWYAERSTGAEFRGLDRPLGLGPSCEIVRTGVYCTDEDDEPTMLYFERVVEALNKRNIFVNLVSVYCAPFRVRFAPALRQALPRAVDGMLQEYYMARSRGYLY
ncbi:hypothetical protein [Candidatus Poriferisodalis sp.]|uniref:hypothetical protein n=1 Tax=Candidatus Poriferisodalis sp. TaxID=3101277 RepID=UPI003B0207F2